MVTASPIERTWLSIFWRPPLLRHNNPAAQTDIPVQLSLPPKPYNPPCLGRMLLAAVLFALTSLTGCSPAIQPAPIPAPTAQLPTPELASTPGPTEPTPISVVMASSPTIRPTVVQPAVTAPASSTPETPASASTTAPPDEIDGSCDRLCAAEFWLDGATVAAVQAELDRGAHPAAGDDGWIPALGYAVTLGNSPEIIRLLLAAGASPNARNVCCGSIPLQVAALYAASGPKDAYQMPGHVDEFEAAIVEIIELLLEYGADATVRGRSGQTTISLYFGTLAEQFLNMGESHVPNARIVELLLPPGLEFTPENDTDAKILTHAMLVGSDPEIIALLLDHGAGEAAITREHGGNTLLHIAAKFNAGPQVFKLLLEMGEDVTVQGPYGWTVLHLAARVTILDPEVVAVLLDAGADVNVVDDDGRTPLHHAAMRSVPEVISLLLDAGADVAARDDEENIPRHLATFGDYFLTVVFQGH